MKEEVLDILRVIERIVILTGIITILILQVVIVLNLKENQIDKVSHEVNTSAKSEDVSESEQIKETPVSRNQSKEDPIKTALGLTDRMPSGNESYAPKTGIPVPNEKGDPVMIVEGNYVYLNSMYLPGDEGDVYILHDMNTWGVNMPPRKMDKLTLTKDGRWYAMSLDRFKKAAIVTVRPTNELGVTHRGRFFSYARWIDIDKGKGKRRILWAQYTHIACPEFKHINEDGTVCLYFPE